MSAMTAIHNSLMAEGDTEQKVYPTTQYILFEYIFAKSLQSIKGPREFISKFKDYFYTTEDGYQLLLQYEQESCLLVEDIFISASAQGDIAKMEEIKKNNNISPSCLQEVLYYAAICGQINVLKLCFDYKDIAILKEAKADIINNILEHQLQAEIRAYLNELNLLFTMYISKEDNCKVTEKLIKPIPRESVTCIETAFNLAIQQRRVETVRSFLGPKRYGITQEMINHALVTRCGDLTSPNANRIEATDIEKDKNIITSLIISTNGQALYNKEVIQYVKDHKLQSLLEGCQNQVTKICECYFRFCVSNIKLGYIKLAIENIKNMKDGITPENTKELMNLLTECRTEAKSFLNTQSYDMAMNMLSHNVNISQGPDNQEIKHVENLQQVSSNQIGK